MLIVKIMEAVKKILIQARYEKSRNWLKARKLMEDGLQAFPGNEILTQELALLYVTQKKYNEAIKVCQKSLLIEHSDQLCYVIASCFLNLHEYQIAVDYFDRINKEFPEHLYNKAVALARCRRYDEAVTLAEKVLDYKVKSPVPSLFLAELSFIQKDYMKTVRICNQVEKRFGVSGELYFMRGMAWRALKNILRAYWEFHKAENFHVKNPEYYRIYGLVAEGIGKTEKAIELFGEAISRAPENVGAYMELFRLYLSNNMLEEATELLFKARDTLPESFPLTVMYNRVIDRLHDAESVK